MPVVYPFGINWKHELIEKSTKALYDVYKEEILNGTVMAFITRGTSGAMIAGAMMNELHHICPFANSCIIVVRKESDTSAHCSSLKGIEDLDNARLIVVDDFISSGNTVLAILEELDRYFEVIPSAKEKYESAKKQYEEMKGKPNKTPEDKRQESFYKKLRDHWKSRMDFKGENHSKNAKGNR